MSDKILTHKLRIGALLLNLSLELAKQCRELLVLPFNKHVGD